MNTEGDSNMFEDNRLYPANADELRLIATYSAMAHWRCEGRGPAYIKLGPKIFYRGQDLNVWINAQRHEPAAA